MQYAPLALIAAALMSGSVIAQEERADDTTATTSNLPSYTVMLTEFRWDSHGDEAVTASDIVAAFGQFMRDKKVEVIQTVRLSAIEQHRNSVILSRMVTVSNGSRSRDIHVGTMVEIVAVPSKEELSVELVYAASRISSERADDKFPDVDTAMFKTTLVVEPGKATLVGNAKPSDTNFLMVTIIQ